MFGIRRLGRGDGTGHSRRSSRACRWTEEETAGGERGDGATKRIKAAATQDSQTGSVASWVGGEVVVVGGEVGEVGAAGRGGGEEGDSMCHSSEKPTSFLV